MGCDTSNMRFLHLADVHLDTAFAGRTPSLRARLRQASRDALGRAVDCALAEKVHAVLIAGDLFDGDRLSFGTELFLLEQLRRLEEAGTTVVYACGNHDPGRTGVRRTVPWPANVVVAADAGPVRTVVRDRDGEPVGSVTAAGHATARETADLSRAFPRPDPDDPLPRVALLHTQVVTARGAEEHDPYAPSELGRLLESGYHYWALGHVHVRQCLSPQPAVHYPGNLQGRTGREVGAKGGLLVDVAPGGEVTVAFRPFAPLRFETLEVGALQEEETLAAVVARVAREWDAARRADPGSPGGEWMVRVVLSGPTPLWRELQDEEDAKVLGRELAEVLGALDVDVWAQRTHPVLSPSDHRGRQDVLGETLRLLEDVRSGQASLPEPAPGELAGLRPGQDPGSYVRELLQDGEGELLARLLRTEG